MYFTAVLGIIILFLFYIFSKRNTSIKLPCGPRGIPFLGNIHQLLVKNPYQKLSQLADIYGKIYTIKLGMSPAIVINDPKLVREIFGAFQSTGKFQTDSVLRISQGPYGVLNSDGESWQEQRTFCLKQMKEFGFGNKHMETLILSEAQTICDWIINSNKNTDGLIHIQPVFMQSVINTIWTMVSGTRITLGETEIVRLMNTFVRTFQYTTKTGLAFLPWLKYLAPGLSGYTAFDRASANVWKYIETEFQNHKKTYVQGAQRDLIDAYIEYAGEDKLKWKNSVATIVVLFIAGSESTSGTLTWVLFYLSQNQEIQRKIQDEIENVIGDELPSLDHKNKMPFTEAVILETFRLSSFAPIGAIHKLLDDFVVKNWKFRKGLLLIANMYHCHYNKKVWGDPEVFRPERFLGENGQKMKEYVIPFQQGKRQCLGEPLARDIIFIFVTKMFQMFNVKPDVNVKPEEYYKADVGYLLFPPSLPLKITVRPN